MQGIEQQVGRRGLLRCLIGPVVIGAVFGPAACAQGPRVYDMKVSRDVGCTCCHAWAELMQKTGRFKIALVDDEDLPALKRKLGVPSGIGACHTGVVEGYVVEGHVPAEDILRLLEMRPADVRGLAVPGMPRGSPGMEQTNGARDPYDVVAFKANGETSVFARHV